MIDYRTADSRLTELPEGLYFHRSASLRRQPGPATIRISGRPYQRFMDYIYVPTSLEELTTPQIGVLNALRLDLMRSDSAARWTNQAVKAVFTRTIEILEPCRIVEWGCGHSNVALPNGDYEYAAVDIDPAVSSYQRDRGLSCVDPSVFSTERAPESVDLIIACFVFHFRIPDEQTVSMYRTLRPGGLIVANVYRRPQSARDALKKSFTAQGFRVYSLGDPRQLCSHHEYWIISKGSVETLVSSLLKSIRESS